MTPFFKAILWISFIIGLWGVSCRAHAITPDELLEGEKIASGQCATTHGVLLPCVSMRFNGKEYLVVLDKEYDPLEVYDVTGMRPPYDLKAVRPVWKSKDGDQTV